MLVAMSFDLIRGKSLEDVYSVILHRQVKKKKYLKKIYL